MYEKFFDLIAERQSCRKYDASRPVEREKLVRILEAGAIAPSACNSQPWKFHGVTDPTLVAALRPTMQRFGMNPFLNDCPAFIVITEEKAKLMPKIASHLSDREFSSLDIGIATAHLALAATAQGLSSCIIGWLNNKKICEVLDLPETTRVRLVLALGYAKEGDPLRRKSRKSFEDAAKLYE